VANDWSLNPVFQGQNGLPYSATIGSGYPSYSAYSSSWNGAGTNYWIPAIGHNTFQQSKTLVFDMRLEKQFPLKAYGKPYNVQLMGEFFNMANHPNVTGVSNTAYNLADNSSVTKACTGTSTVTGQAAGRMLDLDLRSQGRHGNQRQRLWRGDQRQLELCLQSAPGADITTPGVLRTL
jgi:hypothetical protein